jgi:hypothetical protein
MTRHSSFMLIITSASSCFLRMLKSPGLQRLRPLQAESDHDPVVKAHAVPRIVALFVLSRLHDCCKDGVPVRSVGPETFFGSGTPSYGNVCHEKH